MRLLLVALLLSTPAVAQKRRPSTAEDAEARAHYQRGMSYYNLREYGIAVVEFKEAYAVSSEPLLLFNIAQAYRLDKQYDEALHYYRTYLRLKPNAATRRDAEQFVGEMEKLLQSEKSLTQEQPPASPAPVIEPAQAADEPVKVKEEPATVKAEPVSPLVSTLHAAPQQKPLYRRWWVWTAAGAAVVVVGVGLAVGLTLGAHVELPAGTLGSIDARH